MSLEPLESQSFKAWNAATDQSYIRLVLPTYRLWSELVFYDIMIECFLYLLTLDCLSDFALGLYSHVLLLDPHIELLLA